MMNTERIKAIEERLAPLVSPPWRHDEDGDVHVDCLNASSVLLAQCRGDFLAAFLAHAREDIPYLLEQLEAANKRAEAAENANKVLRAACDFAKASIEARSRKSDPGQCGDMWWGAELAELARALAQTQKEKRR